MILYCNLGKISKQYAKMDYKIHFSLYLVITAMSINLGKILLTLQKLTGQNLTFSIRFHSTRTGYMQYVCAHGRPCSYSTVFFHLLRRPRSREAQNHILWSMEHRNYKSFDEKSQLDQILFIFMRNILQKPKPSQRKP